MMMHSALRCSKCCISWPLNRDLYGHCPECGAPTETLTASSAPIGEEEAKERAGNALFARWLEAESDEDRVMRETDADEEDGRLTIAGRVLLEEFEAIMEGITEEEWFRMHFEFLEAELALLD